MQTEKTESAAPARTDEQRMEALKRANNIRTDRARLKKQMRGTANGSRRGSDKAAPARRVARQVLTDVPAFMATCTVQTLLEAIPGVGRVKANKIMQAQRVSPSKTVGGLSQRQRRELTMRLAD